MRRPLLLPMCLLAMNAATGAEPQAGDAQRRLDEHLQHASRWDHATAERLLRRGSWREGVAYLGRACRLDPRNRAAAQHLWSAVVHGEGDRNTVAAFVLSHDAEIYVGEFSPDGRRILTASADKTARLWDAVSGVPIGEPLRHEDEVMAAAFSPDGARVVTASQDRTARLWDAATAKPLCEPIRHEHPLDAASFNATGTRVVTECREAGTAQLWDAATGRAIGSPFPHKNNREPTAFSPDGTRLVSTDDEKAARLWDTANGKAIGKPLRHPAAVEHAVFSPDGSRVLTTAEDGKARVWSVASGKLIHTLATDDEMGIADALFSPDGARVVTLSLINKGQLWDATTGKRVGRMLRCAMSDAEYVPTAVFSPDGTCVVLHTSDDPFARLWFCENGEPLGAATSRLFGEPALRHDGEVREAIFTPDGTRLITASADDTVRVWEIPNGKPVGQPLRHDLPGEPTIEHLAVSPDGTRILSVCGDHTVRVWEASPVQPFGERVEGAGTHERGKTGVVASPDGTRTASLTDDRTAQLRDAKKDEPIGEPLRHREDVKNIAFSPDGALLVTACADGTARLWDTATGAPASEPMRQEFDARTTFMPDGRQLASETEHSRRLREAPPAFADATAPPEAFIEALTGYRFSPDGMLRELSAADLAGLRASLRDDRAGDSAWRPLIDWWLTPRQTRTLSPGSKMTRRELADRELASRDRDAILNAYLLDPTHPLVHLALASLDDYEPRTNFLRAFALQRLPTDAAIRARAAQMLREQGRAQQAARVESAKP